MAKVQKTVYGPIDDPILGGFMDAFCDKASFFLLDSLLGEKFMCSLIHLIYIKHVIFMLLTQKHAYVIYCDSSLL